MSAPTTAEVRERIGARVAMMRAADIKDGGGTAHQAYAWALTETALPIAEHRDALAAEVARLRAILECGASPYGVHRCVHCDSEVT